MDQKFVPLWGLDLFGFIQQGVFWQLFSYELKDILDVMDAKKLVDYGRAESTLTGSYLFQRNTPIMALYQN